MLGDSSDNFDLNPIEGVVSDSQEAHSQIVEGHVYGPKGVPTIDRNPGGSEEVELPVGIEGWQEFYRARLNNTLIEVTASERGWHTDPIATEEFRTRLQAALDEYTSNPGVKENQAALSRLHSEASELLVDLHQEGQLLSIGSDSARALLPYEVRTLTAVLRSLAESSGKGAIGADPGRSLFQVSLASHIVGQSADIKAEQFDSLQRKYDELFMPWLFAKAERDFIRAQASQLARDLEILSPHPQWLPEIFPRFGELNDEILFYEEELTDYYSSVLPSAPEK